MESKIVGTVMPVLELSMKPNDKVFAESGELSWMSMAIQMQTSTSAGGQQGGFMGALGRAVADGTLFMTEYTAGGGWRQRRGCGFRPAAGQHASRASWARRHVRGIGAVQHHDRAGHPERPVRLWNFPGCPHRAGPGVAAVHVDAASRARDRGVHAEVRLGVPVAVNRLVQEGKSHGQIFD